MKSLVVFTCLGAFIAAGILHFAAESKAALKSPLLPKHLMIQIQSEIEQLNLFRLLAFGLGITFLILSIKLLGKKNKELTKDDELIDDLNQ